MQICRNNALKCSLIDKLLTALLPFLAKNLLFLISQTQCDENFLFRYSCRVKQGCRLANPERTAERKFNKHWAHEFESVMPSLLYSLIMYTPPYLPILLPIGANLLKTEMSFVIVSSETLNLRASSGQGISRWFIRIERISILLSKVENSDFTICTSHPHLYHKCKHP